MRSIPLAWLLAACTAAGAAHAETGKLPLTGGVTSIEGAAGGGLTPWAVIGTGATEGEVGVAVTASRAVTRDYALNVTGVMLGWRDRVELSYARQSFDASPAVALNGIAPFGVQPSEQLGLDVVGAKLRVAGEAVLDADTWMPQVAVGVQHKQLSPGSLGSVVDFLGARRSGTDVYVSATKLFLAPGLLANLTVRSTNANQGGLLGFGASGPGRSSRSLQPELSVGWLVRRDLVVGAEVRFKPNNLEALGRAAGLGDALREDRWQDVFVAWSPTRHLTVTAAWVQLGRVVPGITDGRRQSGAYLSLQAAL